MFQNLQKVTKLKFRYIIATKKSQNEGVAKITCNK